MDKAHKKTDKIIKNTERKINGIYAKERERMEKKANSFLKRFEKDDKSMRSALANGSITDKEYRIWRTETIASGEHFRTFSEDFAKAFNEIDKQAINVVNNSVVSSYTLNRNATAKEISKKVNINFNIYNEQTVKRLNKKGTVTLPLKSVKKEKNLKWTTKSVNRVVRNGIIKGDTIQQIASQLSRSICNLHRQSATTIARTSVTNAENAGRMDMLNEIKEDYGIETKKQWVATNDDRTRETHAEIDGEIVDLDEEFSNGLRYPADELGDAEEVYNCRCTMVYLIKGVDY